jgi:chromosome partitioning protein
VVANRVRRNTLVYQSLQRFLATLNVPVVATLRDSQNYVRSAELGIGIHEMRPYLVADDLAQWQPLMDWIEGAAGAALPSDASPDDDAQRERRLVEGAGSGLASFSSQLSRTRSAQFLYDDQV